MKIIGINGLISKMAELRRLWTDYDKSWDRKGKSSELLDSDSASSPQVPPQLALHHPKRSAAWFFRTFMGRRSVADIRTKRRSPWRATIGEGGGTEHMIGATQSSAASMAESESITGMPEKIVGMTESDPGAIDLPIRARNKNVAWNQRVALFFRVSRQEGSAQAEYIIGTAASEFTKHLNSRGNSL